MKLIDSFLDYITMYRLMLYYLVLLVVVAAVFSLFGIIPFSFSSVLISVLFITAICWFTNTILAKVFHAPTNLESVYITALILTLIITPLRAPHDLIFLGTASIFAMASKYILAIHKKHIFNPAAIAVTLTALIINQSASWWVGNLPMLPFVAIAGLLIARKTKRFSLVASFIFSALAVILGSGLLRGTNLLAITSQIFFVSPLLFFAFVMLSEPLTTPPTQKLQIYYGVLVGALFYITPEIALIIGNIFSYLVSPKQKLTLKLKEKVQLSPALYEFIFTPDQTLQFIPGQYLEWTLAHPHPDSRGTRRYFTIASSPTESDIHLGIKFYDPGSSFKRFLSGMKKTNLIMASQLAGEFVLPKDPNQKLVFISGGIGVTPFRSIAKHLLDTHASRPIIHLYSNKTADEVVYKDTFDRAEKELGIKTVYISTSQTGRLSASMLQNLIPDFKDRVFYLSGPHSLVTAFTDILHELGISNRQIKTDFFPGYT